MAAVRAEVDQIDGLDDGRLRERLGVLQRRWCSELDQVLSEPLARELHDFVGWLDAERASPTELRLGLAQLEGWLDGLISGMSPTVARSAT